MKIILMISLFVLGVNSEALGRTSLEQIWSLPAGVIRHHIFDQMSWQGLDMRAEALHIPMPIELFAEELAHLIPVHSLMTRESGGLRLSWLHENVSYLLITHAKTDGSSGSDSSTGFISSISLNHPLQHKEQSNLCAKRWLPDHLHSLFSMRDAVRDERFAWMDAYVSESSVDFTYAQIIRRLKAAGWMIAGADLTARISQNLFSVRASCGRVEMNVDVHKDTALAHMLVTRVE